MSAKSLSFKMKNKLEPINQFDKDFLNSKDVALQPIAYFFDTDCKEELPSKERHLSLKNKKAKNGKKSDRSKKSELSQQSQKSTNNTNKKSNRKKSIHDSQLYNSNIVIVQYNDEDDKYSSTDEIGKEIEKLQKLLSKSKEKKKKSKKSNKKNPTNNDSEY